MMTLGRDRRGWSLGSGSGSVTSRAAAPMRFCDDRFRQGLRVDHRAASDIDQGGVGLHQGELAAPILPRVWSVSGTQSIT